MICAKSKVFSYLTFIVSESQSTFNIHYVNSCWLKVKKSNELNTLSVGHHCKHIHQKFEINSSNHNGKSMKTKWGHNDKQTAIIAHQCTPFGFTVVGNKKPIDWPCPHLIMNAMFLHVYCIKILLHHFFKAWCGFILIFVIHFKYFYQIRWVCWSHKPSDSHSRTPRAYSQSLLPGSRWRNRNNCQGDARH